jgi:hypothetical protein
MKIKNIKKNSIMKYYHITHKKNKESILTNGLKCNSEGQIFFFENKSISGFGVVNTIADMIARNQVFLDNYSMFEIDSEAFETNLINDNVGELSSKQQWYIYQDIIDPTFINLLGDYKTNYTNFLSMDDFESGKYNF